MAINNYGLQLAYTGYAPLDATSQVATYEDLIKTGSDKKLLPYVGKLVHVLDEHKFYSCKQVIKNAANKNEGVWTPIFNDTGTEFYLTAPDGRVLTLRAAIDENDTSKLRLEVEYPQLS